MVKTKVDTLAEIAIQVSRCQRCDLYRFATHPVPGDGSGEATVMFIGEGPGYFEDNMGKPFVGQAGKLLDKLLASIDLARSEVFITNMVKHRPPQNRDPSPEEIEACSVYLDEQIRLIEPKIIVTLGRFSMNKFLPDARISGVHGQARFVDFGKKRYIVIPMYHPAAALRSGQIMQELMKDFLKITKFLGKDVPAQASLAEATEDKEEQLNLIS